MRGVSGVERSGGRGVGKERGGHEESWQGEEWNVCVMLVWD